MKEFGQVESKIGQVESNINVKMDLIIDMLKPKDV